jgi:hypothetical protein
VSPFSRRALLVLFGLGGLSFLCALVFAFAEEDPAEIPDHRANAHSRSAIGHSDAVALLERLDIPVIVSHADSAQRARGGLLVLAEPDAEHKDRFERSIEEAIGPVLIVLPKRSGVASPEDRGVLASQTLLPAERVATFLDALPCPDGEIVRGDDKDVAAPQSLRCGAVSDTVVTLDGHLTVLADPDLMANHGLGQGDHARRFVALVDQLRAGGPVVFDETIHGGQRATSLRHELLRPPLLYASLAALLLAAILLWSMTARFGKPLPPPPALAAGKRLLIENTAALVRLGGHVDFAVARYLQQTVQLVAQKTHAPPHLTGAPLHAWLEEIGRARGVTVRLADLDPTRGTVAAALRIDDWRRQMTEEQR